MGFLALAQTDVADVILESEGVFTRFLERFTMTKVEVILLLIIAGLLIALARKRGD